MIFYGHDLEEKRAIFERLLPNEHEQFTDRRLYTSNMIDIESDSEPGDYDFFEKYDEQGDAIENRPKYLGNNHKYPFDIPEAQGKIKPAMLKTLDAKDLGEDTEWVRAKLEMQRTLNNPAKHSQEVNNMITISQRGVSMY